MNMARNLIPIFGANLLVRFWLPSADGPVEIARIVELEGEGWSGFTDARFPPFGKVVESYTLFAVSGRLAFAPVGLDLAQLATATAVAYGVRDNRGCRYITERLSVEHFVRGGEDGRITVKGDAQLWRAVAATLDQLPHAPSLTEVTGWWVSFLLEPEVQALAICVAVTADYHLRRGHSL